MYGVYRPPVYDYLSFRCDMIIDRMCSLVVIMEERAMPPPWLDC